jgi:hypothetical protein
MVGWFNWKRIQLAFPNPVDLALSGENITLDGLNYAWMQNIWGRQLQLLLGYCYFNSDGTLEIATQHIYTRLRGNPYNYSITGSGTYSLCDPITLHIEYDMYNTTDDYSLGEWVYDNGYSSTIILLRILVLEQNPL